MKIGSSGKALLTDVEGRTNTAYRDSAGLWTTGIGHLIKPNEAWMITAKLTDAQVDDLFHEDIAWAEAATERLFPKVKKQNQFDALVSFVFNLGEGQVRNGMLDDLINSGAPAEEISAKWMQYVRAGGQVVPGLIKRRMRELALYWKHLWGTVVLCLVFITAALASAAIVLAA